MSRSIRGILSFLLVLQLAIPCSTFAAAIGQFRTVAGNVTQSRATEVIRPVAKSAIFMKDLIATARSSTATMVFSDDSTITLSENSKLEIREFLFKGESRRGIFSLPMGKVMAEVKKYIGGDNVFEVHSPTVAVGVRGTGFEFVEAVKEEKAAPDARAQREATVTCTEGSLNLSALSPTGEVISTAVLEAGQVAVIVGGIITISKIVAAAATAGISSSTGAGAGTGGAAAAATGLSTSTIAGLAIGGAAAVGATVAAVSSGGGGGDGGGTPCTSSDGKWAGTWSGTACGTSESGTWIMNCSRCSCPGTIWSSNLGSHTGNCSVSGNGVSCTMGAVTCFNNVPCTVNASGTISGNSVNGSYGGCNGISGNWSGARQ